jgi:hypothetical protein
MAGQEGLPTAIINGKKMVNMAGRWQPAEDVITPDSTHKAALEETVQSNLKKATGGEEGDLQSLNDKLLDHLLEKIKPDPKTDPKGYMQDLQFRIADMETKAKEVKKSKTGNVQAEQTYMQVSKLLKQKLIAMQNAAIGAESQPAPEGQ